MNYPEDQHYGRGLYEQRAVPLYYRMLFSFSIMGLFIAWLLPLHRSTSITDTARLLVVLMITAAVLLLWGMLQLPGPLLLGVQFAIIAVAWIYTCSAETGPGWIAAYKEDIPKDALLLLSGQLSQVSEGSRLLILITGWGLLVSSVQQLALYRGSTLLFAAATMVYLLGLDFAFGVNTTMEIIISAGLILWMQAMSGLVRLRERTNNAEIPYVRWGSLTLAAAVALMTTAWLGGQLYGSRPVSEVALQSAVGKLQEWAAGHVSEDVEMLSAGTTGYGSGDGELGAPLSPSTEPVFTAETGKRTYWRGESVAYYDGRRWIRGGESFMPLNLSSLPVSGSAEPGAAESRMLVQRIQFAAPSSGGLPLFNAGTVTDVEAVQLADGSRLGYVLANKSKESFRLPDIAGSARITEYTVRSFLPETDPAVLRGLSGGDPRAVTSKYLQLPDRLPKRVGALAKELTGSAGNRYDAADAVREYLQSRYSYTLDTALPPPDADFVDDFLFTAKQGYCVHFATAMTILLRSADIPARYVQGYGPGTLQADSQPQRYAVTQGDAHAWVEVYFAGAGWVPFDPTPGSAAGPAAPPLPAAASAAPHSPAALRAGGLPALAPPGGSPPAPLIAAALLVPAAAWRWRRSLALLLAARSAGSRERQLRAASLAWQGLAARYGPPPPGVTCREYAASLQIDDAGLRAAVRRFVRQWEALAYSGGAQAFRAAPPSPPSPSGNAPADAAAFIRECLMITFRLT